MADQEEDPQVILRLRSLAVEVERLFEGFSLDEKRVALANLIGVMCLGESDPDAVFLRTQEMLSEVFRAMREHLRGRQAPPDVPPTN